MNLSSKAIYIDSLTGYNDIAITLKARALKNEILGIKETLPSDLLQNFNQQITLKNISIQISGDFFSINFELYNKPWTLLLLPDEWKLMPGFQNLKEFTTSYEDEKKNAISDDQSGQKSISEILKLKHQEILKKKASSKNAQSKDKRETMMALNKTRN